VVRARRIARPLPGLPKTDAALAYAERAHGGQQRDADGAPFIDHLTEVASLLYHAGASDAVIAAGALHDTIEKADVGVVELRTRFGSPVADLVAALTEDPRIPQYGRRKAALREQVAAAGEDALMVFAADKISKARELRLKPGRPRRQREERFEHYRKCLEMLEQRLPDSPLVAELRDELDSARSDIAASAVHA
jgi:(p)ppGpp synthase/HD superfamily hydrolase